MIIPIVTEQPLRLEPAGRDTFADQSGGRTQQTPPPRPPSSS
jgi:hypothetical protein